MKTNKTLQKKWYDKAFNQNQWDDSSLSFETKYFIDRFLDLVVKKGTKHVLEIGCGDGLLTSFLLKRKFDKIYAIDISAVAIEGCHRKFVRAVRSGRLELVKDDLIHYLKTSTQKYDLIVGSGILHHIDKKRLSILIKESHNKLNKGGIFACTPEPNAFGFWSLLWRLAPFIYKIFRMEYNWEVEKGTLNMKPGFLKKILIGGGIPRQKFYRLSYFRTLIFLF